MALASPAPPSGGPFVIAFSEPTRRHRRGVRKEQFTSLPGRPLGRWLPARRTLHMRRCMSQMRRSSPSYLFHPRREQYVLPCYRVRLSRERARRLVRCCELGQASAVLVFQIFMGVAPYKRVKTSSCAQYGPAGTAATPTEPKHLGTRLHRWNHENPAPSHDPPSDYAVATNECAALQGRGHRRVASAKSWPAPDERCECPLFAL